MTGYNSYTIVRRSLPYLFIRDLVIHMCAPNDVTLTLCKDLRRTLDKEALHHSLWRWDLPKLTYIQTNHLETDDSTYRLKLNLPPKGREVIAVLTPGQGNEQQWLSFEYDDMFMAGKFEEKYANRETDSVFEGPYI